jgi:hypothetical protein
MRMILNNLNRKKIMTYADLIIKLAKEIADAPAYALSIKELFDTVSILEIYIKICLQHNNPRVLDNGATVILESSGVILAWYRGQLVTWTIDHNPCYVSHGHYFRGEQTSEAIESFNNRLLAAIL